MINAQVVGFAEGTPILMADGTWKAIEQVKQGDWVMSFDPKIENSPLEPQKVVDTVSTMHRDCIEIHANGKVTIVAKNQLFFTPGANWAPGYETKQIIDYSGYAQNIQTRKVRGGKFKVFDLQVEKTHSLVANDLRVHNFIFGLFGITIKRKVVQRPQPVVTAGKPGKPVSVTTTTNGRTTTVVVNPSPGSSGQISVGASGQISVRQNAVPGLPISEYAYYQPPVVLPYPGGSYVHDRALNAEIIRSSVCGNILDKGNNYRVTRNDEIAWEAEIDTMIAELNTIKDLRVPVYTGPYRTGTGTFIRRDTTSINDAINAAQALKREIRAGRRVSTGVIRQNCDKIASIINRVRTSVPDISNPVVIIPGSPPARPVVVVPGPSNYHTDRIYEDDANYSYMLRLASGCSYVYDPPNAPANTKIRYYKHWDPVANKYYYDRVSSGATCTTFGGNTQA
jgi:hypothetical protein